MTNALKNNVFFLKGILTSIITIFWIASFIIIPKQSFAESFSKDEDSKQYEEALSLRKKGNYSEAVDIFQQLSGYKDADKLYIKTFKELLRRSALGDTIKFGSIKDLDLLWFVLWPWIWYVLMSTLQTVDTEVYSVAVVWSEDRKSVV